MTNAAEATEDKDKTVNFITQERYPRLLAEAQPNVKCLPCLLCEPVCPTKAIKVTFNKTREDHVPLTIQDKRQYRSRCREVQPLRPVRKILQGLLAGG